MGLEADAREELIERHQEEVPTCAKAQIQQSMDSLSNREVILEIYRYISRF